MACGDLSLCRPLLVVFFTCSIIILQLSSDNWLPHPEFKSLPIYKVFDHQNETTSTESPSKKGQTQPIPYTSDKYTSADIVNPKTSYEVNDTIQIRITARDVHDNLKTYGGDYFRVKLYTAELQASLSIDVTKDLGNGTYLADVTLRWPGKVDVIVTLVHPSEAIRVLQRIRDLEPGRSIYTGRYFRKLESGADVFEDVLCLPKLIHNQSICNFTDARTGYPWYCVAPSNTNLTCRDWIFYTSDHNLCNNYTMEAVTDEEKEFFNVHKLPIKKPPSSLIVRGDMKSWAQSVFAYQDSLPPCKPGQHLQNPTPSGFYSRNVWFSDQCKLRRFTKPDVLQCLQNRQVHIFGDSTSRQIYLELAGKYRPEVVGSKPKDKSQSIAGPLHATSTQWNISVEFKFHGHPARPSQFIRQETIHYVVNMLDDLEVDSRTVVLICVGTHFTTYSLPMYEERMGDILAAVRRLHKRSPETLVIFKSANTRGHKVLLHQLHNSEWYIRTLDLSLRAVIRNSPELAFVDAWDMTTAQNFQDSVHPNAKVVSNIFNNFLSYVCPQKLHS